MDFRQLEVFIAVVELSSFSKAGEQLYLSQPTVSAHISALEKELEMCIRDRAISMSALSILWRSTALEQLLLKPRKQDY